MLKYFQYEGQFPTQKNQIPLVVVDYIAKQINCASELFLLYDWSARVTSYHRSQIREFFGYRRMVPEILAILDFRSNNEVHRPVIHALNVIKKYNNTGHRYFPIHELIPINGVIRPLWRELIIEKDDKDQERINCINYEISTLQALRDKLRCKEIWVSGSNRYRNPEEDLPIDFDQFREENYKALKQPLAPDTFIDDLKLTMKSALDCLNANILKNPNVKILTKGNGWITITPFDPQPEPANLLRLKSEVQR